MNDNNQQELLPFDQWFNENDASIIDVDAYQCAKAAWYAALRWGAEEQVPDAWATEEEPPRLVNHKTKGSTLFKTASKSFCVPLFRHPHHATKHRRNLSEDS